MGSFCGPIIAQIELFFHRLNWPTNAEVVEVTQTQLGLLSFYKLAYTPILNLRKGFLNLQIGSWTPTSPLWGILSFVRWDMMPFYLSM